MSGLIKRFFFPLTLGRHLRLKKNAFKSININPTRLRTIDYFLTPLNYLFTAVCAWCRGGVVMHTYCDWGQLWSPLSPIFMWVSVLK